MEIHELLMAFAAGFFGGGVFRFAWRFSWPGRTAAHDEHRFDTMKTDGRWRCGVCGKVKSNG